MKHGIKRRLGVSDDAAGLRPSLRETLEMMLEQGPEVIESIIDGLAGKAGQAGASAAAQSSPAGQAAALLKEQREAVSEFFCARLREEMYSGVKAGGGAMQALVRFDSLDMLEEDQLDESIELARAQQEVAFAVDDVLPPLDALMSAQLGWLTVQPQINPLRPEVFVRSLRATLAQFLPDNALRDAIITAAAGRMGSQLNKLYREMADWLRSSGVEAVTPQLSAAVQARTPPKPGSVANTILTLDRLRKLLSGELGGGGAMARGPGQDFLHTVPASFEALQDMKQVEAMMQRLARKAQNRADTPASTPAAKPDLSDSRQLGKHLGQEVVRLMVENLTQDERLLSRVRAQLQLLEPMLMDLAQADPKFFNDKQHPARRFLERVTHRSLGFASEKDEGFAMFERSVEKAIAALQQHAKDGVAPFGPVIDKLEAAWDRADAAERQRREEAARALVHAEQRNLLAQKHAEEFRAGFDSRDVPPFVANFLCGPWAHVVAESELRSTDGVADRDGYRALVDDLVWSLQARSARRNRPRLVAMIPELLAKLRAGLKTIDYPVERIPAFFDDLISLHEAVLEDSRPRVKPRETAPEAGAAQAAGHASQPAGVDDATQADAGEAAADSVLDSQGADEIWLGHKEAQESGFLDEAAVMPLDLSGAVPPPDSRPGEQMTINELSIGAWVELMINGGWVRAQLSWASPHRTLFMFTSSHGGAAHSMTRRTMDRLRTEGLIRVVSDGEMIDQALDAVAQAALKNSLGPE